VDTQGKLLTGKEQYTITFKRSIPYAQAIPPGFWSVTMNDGMTKLTDVVPWSALVSER
jgi:hypothetical protein